MKIDWSTLSAEATLEVLKDAPRVAGVWQYSDITQGYARRLLWDPKKGMDVTWLSVANVWTTRDRNEWYSNYAYDGNEFQNALGPFDTRFEAAKAVDDFLEKNGWKVIK